MHRSQVSLKRRQFDQSGQIPVLDDEKVRGGQANWFNCVACNARITSPLFAVSVAGSHAHTFTNPAAIDFHIGCFSEVENCAKQGMRTPQDTWFPGYYWQILKCASCGLQLGWEFSGPDIFYGLIANRLQHSDE